jgi:mannonate dehydratase
MTELDEVTREVFPGSPTFDKGYMYVNETPGLGVDIDEQLAGKFPASDSSGNWLPIRRADGSAIRP